MRHTLLLTTFLVSTLYCGVSNAQSLKDLELAPLPGISDSDFAPLPADYKPMPLQQIKTIDQEGTRIYGVVGQLNKEENDDNLTADSDPLGGYPKPSVRPLYSTNPVEFEKKQDIFKKLLQDIKDEKSGKIVKPKKKTKEIEEYTGEDEVELINREEPETSLTPLNLALDVFAEPEIIEWLIQSGANLPEDIDTSSDSVIYHAIGVWRDIELFKDKGKAKEIYFKNIQLLLDKKVKMDGLGEAISVRQYDLINLLLNRGYVKPTQRDLSEACQALNWETIQKILDTGLDINALSNDYGSGTTPLMVAVEEKRLDIVEKLLEAGADPNQKSYLSRYSLSKLTTPLEATNDLRIIRTLLKAGAKPELSPKDWDNIRESYDKSDKILIKILIKYNAKGVFLSPTFWKMAKPEDVKAQIQKGEDVNEIGYKGWTPLMYANKFAKNPQEMITLLKQNGATGGILPWDFNLELTAENIQKQIANGANPNTEKAEGRYENVELKTPLILAIESQNIPAIKTLLENKVILNGTEPLFYALGKDHVRWGNPEHPVNTEIVKLLLDAGINPNNTEIRTVHDMMSYDYNTSPLIIAIQRDNLELVKLLLKYGADPNQLVEDKTPLMQAASPWNNNQYIEIIKALLQSGADINKQDSKGRNVLFHVQEKKDSDSSITELLIQNGANINAKDRYGRSAFMNQATDIYEKNVQLVKKMIEMGADINAMDNDKTTVLEMVSDSYKNSAPAYQPPKKEIMDLLIAKGAKPPKTRYAWKEGEESSAKLENFWHNVSANQIKEMIAAKSILDSTQFIETVKKEPEQQEKAGRFWYRDRGTVIGAFCSAGDNPTQQDILNASLLNAARYQAPVEVIQYLLDAGADVNTKDKDGRTPFIWASLDNADPRTLDLLIKSGARINARDSRGRSAIYYASGSNNKIEIIQKLIDLGIDLQNEDISHITPLDYANMVSKKDENNDSAAGLIRKYNGLHNRHGRMDECQFHRNGTMDHCNGYIV